MTPALSTNGLVPPSDFPSAPYEKVHSIVSARCSGSPIYEHYSGAWNAVAYRFRSFARAGETFTVSLQKHGAAPDAEERYIQEEALYEFFTAGFSVFESAFYALFALGAFRTPSHFPLSTPKEQQQVSPNRTREAYRKAFPNDAIVSAIETLFIDTAYQGLREIRNVLTHRTAPGRRIYLSVGSDDTPPVEWKLNNIALDSGLASRWRTDIVRTSHALITAIGAFVERNIA